MKGVVYNNTKSRVAGKLQTKTEHQIVVHDNKWSRGYSLNQKPMLKKFPTKVYSVIVFISGTTE